MKTEGAASSSTLTDAEKIRRLPWLALSQCFSGMYQATALATPFVLFCDELGFAKTQVGLLFSLIHLLGPLALVIAPAVERFGLKRTHLTFYGVRKFVALGVVAAPWIASRFGLGYTFAYVAAVVGLFGLLRVVGETAYYPWMQEVIPNSVRGKFSAIGEMLNTLGGLAALAASGYVIGRYAGLWRYQAVMAAGCAAGLVSVLVKIFLPGGQPREAESARSVRLAQLRNVLGDRDLVRFVSAMALVTIGASSWGVFAPLFLKDQVGLTQSQVVLLQSGTMLGGFVSSYLWGWAADRYGSRPVALAGALVLCLLPLGWLTMPRHSDWSLTWAAAVAVVLGGASIGWSIGQMRLLYVSVVPPERKMEYLAVFYAAHELVLFVTPVSAGWMLDYLQVNPLIGSDPYTPVFILSMVLTAAGLLPLWRVRDEGAITAGRVWARLSRSYPALAAAVRRRAAAGREDPQS